MMNKNTKFAGLLLFIFCFSLIIFTRLCEVKAENTDIAEVCTSKGWKYFENKTETIQFIKSYADETCYEDKNGVYVVIKDIDENEITAIGNSDNNGLYSKYSEISFKSVYETSDLSATFGNGYKLLHITREALETHSKDYTKEMFLQADEKLTQIAENCKDKTDYEKIKEVYYYLCENVAYDNTYVKGTPYSAVIEKSSVCSGYAESFQIVMEKLGIECYICAGNISGVPHAWNAVKLDGKIYYVDSTFGRLYGNEERFFLFGTDRRANIFEITIADHAYKQDSPGKAEEKTEVITESTEEKTEVITESTEESAVENVDEKSEENQPPEKAKNWFVPLIIMVVFFVLIFLSVFVKII